MSRLNHKTISLVVKILMLLSMLPKIQHFPTACPIWVRFYVDQLMCRGLYHAPIVMNWMRKENMLQHISNNAMAQHNAALAFIGFAWSTRYRQALLGFSWNWRWSLTPDGGRSGRNWGVGEAGGALRRPIGAS